VEPAVVPEKPAAKFTGKGKSEKTQREESESDSSSDDSDDDESDSDESNSDTSSSESSSDDNDDATEKVRQNGGGKIEQERPSSLAHLSRSSVVLDPQVELCRFDLQGRCNDKTCPYQHLRPTTSPPPPTPYSPPKLR
jgi:hypothetical protein